MRPRVLITCAAAVIIATGVGVAVWTATRPSTQATPSSPLDTASPLTCPASPGRDCLSPGTVRWALPLPGRYSLDGSSDALLVQQGHVPRNPGGFALYPSQYPAAATAGGVILYQQGGLVEAVDSATGNLRWKVNLNPGSELWNAVGSTGDSQAPVVSGNQVAAVAVTGDGSAAWVWLLDATSGAVRGRIAVSPNEDPDMTVLAPTASGLAVEMGSCGAIENLAWTTGSVSWRVSLPGVPEPFVTGSVAYCPEGTTIQPVNLDTGGLLPALPLPAGLRQAPSVVTVTAEGTLVASSLRMIAGIDAATGRMLWSAQGHLAIDSNDALLLLPDPASSPPAGAYLVQDAGYRLIMVQLDTGRQVWTAKLSSSLFGDYVQGDLLQGLNRLEYDSAVVTDSPASWFTPPRAGADWTQLEGLDPSTGRVRWTSPWLSAYMEVLGATAAGPPEIVAASCAPDGVHLGSPVSGFYPNGTCTAARLFAVNAG